MDTARGLYLDLMKRCLTRSAFPEPPAPIVYKRGSWQRAIMAPVQAILARKRYLLCAAPRRDDQARSLGEDWPADAETMIGLARLENLQACAEDVIQNNVPGDFIETGVWRGGACIFMRAIIGAYGDAVRRVWVCDSFQGVPKPNAAKYAADAAEDRAEAFWKFDQLAISEAQVRANFARYGLLDDQVRFLAGWFKDSLPTIPATQRFALIRLDGDLYESTWDALINLYPRLSVGGYCLVDDYGGIPACAKAVDDYRAQHSITAPIKRVDSTGIYWQRLT